MVWGVNRQFLAGFGRVCRPGRETERASKSVGKIIVKAAAFGLTPGQLAIESVNPV